MAGNAEGSVPQVRSEHPGLDLHHPEVSPACMAPPVAIQRRRVGPGRPVMQTPGPPRRPGYRPMNAPQMRAKPEAIMALSETREGCTRAARTAVQNGRPKAD
jgi:hypothetical protein